MLAKFGVPPDRIVDYLTLIGDTVDNVPGVEKCGPKTAVKWLQEYGSLDAIVANANSIKGVVGENLRRALDFLPLGRRLVTIATDVPLAQTLEELTWVEQDTPALIEQFRRYEFRGWLRELEGAAVAAATPEVSSEAALLAIAGAPDSIEATLAVVVAAEEESMHRKETTNTFSTGPHSIAGWRRSARPH